MGSHFGIFAKPVPAFINDVTANPDDVSAVITWSSAIPATGVVLYGIDTSVSNSSAVSSELSTNHSITLNGLTPNTLYYYQVQSATNGGSITSPLFTFTTTNYVTTNIFIELGSNWKYNDSDLNGVNWTAWDYDDSGWGDPVPALLWADSRGPNANLTQLASSMPIDPATGDPYSTYYFRTAFSLPGVTPGIALSVSAFVDDGAIFYLNGAEVYRLRMADARLIVSYNDLANGYPCDGDATCSDDFSLPEQAAQALQPGLNVFAAEVHNYNAKSPDITFGASLIATVPRPKPQPLSITFTTGSIFISWSVPGTLQEAGSPDGPWIKVSGSTVSSPWQVQAADHAHYYRLH